MAKPVPLDMLPTELRAAPSRREVPADMLPPGLIRAAPEPEAEKPEEELGFFGALKRGFTTLGDVPEALGFAMDEEGAREALVKAQETEEKRAEGFGLDKTLGENVQALSELAGESLGFMAAPLAAGAAGSLVGGPVGGGIAAAATLLSQYGTQNLARQAQEDEARIAQGEAPLGAMPGRAAAAAVGQAGLDVAGFALPVLRPVAAAFPFLRPLIGAGGKKAAGEVTEAIVEAAAKKQLTIKGGIARGVAQGVAFEIPQEVAQTVLERWQAKLDLTGDDAQEEYKQAAIGAAVLGGGFGAIGGGVNAAKERADAPKEPKTPDIATALELSTPEEKAEFERLLTPVVNEYANANPSAKPADIFKALRDDDTLRSLGNQARTNVKALQDEEVAGAGAGAAGGPDVDVTGTAGPSVPSDSGAVGAGAATGAAEQAQAGGMGATGVPTGTAATGEDIQQRPLDATVTGPAADAITTETGAVAALTPESYVDRYLAGEGRGTTPEDLEFQQYGANFGPDIEAEFARRQATGAAAPAAQVAEDFYPDLAPAYAADKGVDKLRTIAPVVANIFTQATGLTGFNTKKMGALPDNVQRAYNATATTVLNAVKRGEVVNPETVAQQKIAEFKVTLPEAAAPVAAPVAAPAAPVVAPTLDQKAKAPVKAVIEGVIKPTPGTVVPSIPETTAQQAGITPPLEAAPAPVIEATPAPAATVATPPTYTYEDLVAEADSLVAPNPDFVQPGEMTSLQFQGFSQEAEKVAAAAKQGAPVPSAAELREDLYKLAGREAPPLEAPAAPPAEPTAVEEYDPDAIAAATGAAPNVWAALSKQVKGKPPAAWDALEEGAQGEFIAAIANTPVDATPVVRAKAIRPIFDAIRTGKPIPKAAPVTEAAPAPEAAPTPEPQIKVEAEPTPKAGGAGKPPKPPSGGPSAAPQPGPKPKKPRVVKINQAKLNWAMRAAGLLERRDSAFRKKLIRSKTAQQLNDSVGEMFFGSRAYQGPINMLRTLRDSLTPQAKKAMLPFLPTDDITRWVGDRLKNVAVINKLIDDMTVYRNKRLEKTSAIQNKWMKFMTDFPKGADILDVLAKLADFHDVDPTLAATPDEYAKGDPEMKRLIKEGASRDKRDNRLGEIDKVYAAKRQLMLRENGSGAGLEIFKLAKGAYRRNLIDSYILTLNRISEAGLSDEANKIAVSRIKFMYKEALARRVYFPTMRYGQFWMSVGKGKTVEYYMFETALSRDKAFAQRKRDMEAENDLRDMDKGNDYKEVTDYLTKGNDASAALKGVFDQLDSGNLENTAQLKDTVFQMYLLALPEGDMRKRFSHRRYVTGFGMDALRDFANSQSRAASQLARLSYAHQVRNAKAALEGEIKGKPDRVDMEPFVSEISKRADAEIDPPVRGGFYGALDKFAGLGNKFVFLWMLTAPKSALIQATQLHTVGLPVLSDEFGFRKVMDIAGRYSMDIILGNKLAIHRKDDNGDIITEFNVNMRDAKFMEDLAKSDPKKHKRLLKAYDYFDQRGTFASTFISDLNETASRPTKVGTVKSALKEGDVLSAAKKGGDAAMQFMSAGFHQMENINRQIMAMTSFELAYEQAKEKGLGDAAAEEQAMERALKVTRETMFNYSNYNKPRAFKNPAGRIAFQFMTYPVMMTSYLVRNFKNMLPGLNAEGKMSAAKRLFGTLGMTAMYAGMTGLPLYGVFMMAAEAAREMLRDDDDFAPYEDDKGNPVGKVDLKFWFENSWLPETFGPDSSIAEALGLPPELAVLLERSIKFGPISALSDMNLASSTSLNDLFFRGDVKADTMEGQFKEILYNQMLGPLGGLISNMTRGAQLYDEGQTTRAMELMLPAFVKGAVRASRLSDEGLKTIDGKVLKDADFYTEGKLFNQILGIGSTETYEMQKQNFESNRIDKEIDKESADLLQQVKRAEQRFREKRDEASQMQMRKAYDAVDAFNRRFPNKPIGGDSMAAALDASIDEQAESVGGISPDNMIAQDIITRRLQGR